MESHNAFLSPAVQLSQEKYMTNINISVGLSHELVTWASNSSIASSLSECNTLPVQKQICTL